MLSALLLLPGLALAAECPGLDDRIAAVDASTTSLTMPLLQAWWAARDQGQKACLAEALDARGLPSWAPPRVFPAEEGTRAPDKGLRDIFHLPNHAENEDFVVWWGESGGVSQGDIDDLLDAFDDAWAREIDEYGLEEPYGTSEYKFNVFIGDTGSGAPSAYGNSGYYDDYGVVETLVNGGSEEWREPTLRLPQRYGAQYVQLRYPSAGTLHVEVEGDPQGSAGDAATWVGTVVFDSTPAEYVPLTFDGGNTRLSMEDADRALNVWLALGVTTPARRSGETFGYRYRVWVEPEAPVDTGTPADTGEGGDEPPGGCSCVSGGGLVAWPVLLGLVGLATRRRR